jgi:hypothetical protein
MEEGQAPILSKQRAIYPSNKIGKKVKTSKKSSQVEGGMLQYVARGPIAQWLELPAHNCAHVSLHTMPTVVGGTEVNVSKAGSYLDGKPEGDSSMTCKSLAEKPGSYAVYG